MTGDDQSADAPRTDANADAGRAETDARRTDEREPRRARPDAGREWEVFVREATADPLRHVGSVTGGTAAVARERAESLFGWAAEATWLCPADEVRRVGGRSLDGGRDAGGGDGGGGGLDGDGDDAAETEVSG